MREIGAGSEFTAELFTEKLYHVMISDKTGRPFISDEYTAYAFMADKDVNDFIAKHRNVSPEKESLINDLSMFYDIGADYLVLKERDKDIVRIKIEEKNVRRRARNRELVRNLLLFLETSHSKYAREMGRLEMIVPLLIDRRQPCMPPNIHYAYATWQESQYYLAFSTLQEFERWNKNCSPVMADLNELDNIRQGKNVIVDPHSLGLVLTDEILKEMHKEET